MESPKNKSKKVRMKIMARILVIESYLAPRETSVSTYAQEQFVLAYQRLHPDAEFIRLNLNKEKKLQTFLTAETYSSFWDVDSDRYIALVNNCDKLIISTNMVNFNISPILKNFLDNILQAGKTFRYKYDGKGKSEGLLRPGIKAQLLMAQGASFGTYPWGNFDNYLKNTLAFAGITDVQVLVFDGTKEEEQRNLTVAQKFALKKAEFDKQVESF